MSLLNIDDDDLLRPAVGCFNALVLGAAFAFIGYLLWRIFS